MKLINVQPVILTAAAGLLRASCPDLPGAARVDAPARVPGRALRVTEAAARLGISRSLVFKLMRDGRLERVRLGARTTRVTESSLLRLTNGMGDPDAPRASSRRARA